MKKLVFFTLVVALCIHVSNCDESDPQPQQPQQPQPQPQFVPQTHEGNLSLETMADVMQFEKDQITRVNGNLFIGISSLTETSNISDLKYLSRLEVVTGKVSIAGTQLTSLEGLDNLRFAGIGFFITSNDLLEEINHLSSLQTSYLGINDITQLQSLEGLSSLGAVMELVEVRFCPALTNLKGLEFLKTVGTLRIEHNSNMTSLDGLQNLERVDHALTLTEMNALENVNGLSSITSIGGEFNLRGNAQLEDFRGMEKLVSIERLSVSSNQSLTSFTGLNGIEEIKNIQLGGNFSLQSLEGLENVKNSDNIYIAGNHMLKDVSALGGIERLKTLFFGINDGLESIIGLNNLVSVDILSVERMPELTDISGFANLELVGDLFLATNEKLTDLNGLQKLESVNRLDILFNTKLENLSALEDLTVNDEVSIQGNPNLTFGRFSLKPGTNLEALVLSGSPLVTSLEGFEGLNASNIVAISEMHGLGGLDGFSGLTQLRSLYINNNENLLNLDGLSNLRQSGSSLQFIDNPRLSDFCGLQNLVNSDDFGGNLLTQNNGYNPDAADIMSGACRND